MKIPNREVHLLKSITSGYGVADEMGHVSQLTKFMAPYDKNLVSVPCVSDDVNSRRRLPLRLVTMHNSFHKRLKYIPTQISCLRCTSVNACALKVLSATQDDRTLKLIKRFYSNLNLFTIYHVEILTKAAKRTHNS